MERLSKLLQEDSELQKLHEQFVLGGVMTEAVFWATKRVSCYLTLSSNQMVTRQRAGFKSVMLSDVKLSADGQMTEKDFWTKYCRAEYLHSTKNAVAVAAVAEAAEDEELVSFLKRDDAWASEARHKDHGMSRDGSDSAIDSQYEEYGRPLSQVLDRHGAVVLEGRSIAGYWLEYHDGGGVGFKSQPGHGFTKGVQVIPDSTFYWLYDCYSTGLLLPPN
ncbi:hypothetical protein RHGRI_010653 [Rhododendron griersonianum]|uniref:BSD domain-containing protein n=1 Tax=Rhododendron griersonianum TaxID=479676 RepID=A0AAV6KKD2_9ERIC|nr:hypothetical protein RHGRI_010653 [Rhododendron griersonianum]